MHNYYRITGYSKEQNCSFIIDSYGYYDQLWKLSSNIVQKGIEIIAVSDSNKFMNGNITWTDYDQDNLIVRATCEGRPKETTFMVEGVTYKALRVDNKIYIPDKSKTV